MAGIHKLLPINTGGRQGREYRCSKQIQGFSQQRERHMDAEVKMNCREYLKMFTICYICSLVPIGASSNLSTFRNTIFLILFSFRFQQGQFIFFI
jgi:hypothetical protein